VNLQPSDQFVPVGKPPIWGVSPDFPEADVNYPSSYLFFKDRLSSGVITPPPGLKAGGFKYPRYPKKVSYNNKRSN
jgi:hypothetical protein